MKQKILVVYSAFDSKSGLQFYRVSSDNGKLIGMYDNKDDLLSLLDDELSFEVSEPADVEPAI